MGAASKTIIENSTYLVGNNARSLRSFGQSNDIDEIATRLHVHIPVEYESDCLWPLLPSFMVNVQSVKVLRPEQGNMRVCDPDPPGGRLSYYTKD